MCIIKQQDGQLSHYINFNRAYKDAKRSGKSEITEVIKNHYPIHSGELIIEKTYKVS